MPDPDLEIRGGWGGGRGGRTVSKNNFFLSLGPQFGLKIKRAEGETGYPIPSPGSATLI